MFVLIHNKNSAAAFIGNNPTFEAPFFFFASSNELIDSMELKKRRAMAKIKSMYQLKRFVTDSRHG